MQLETVPEWLGAALAGAAIALVGFVGKTILEAVHRWRTAKRERRAELVELHSLLKASRSIFKTQLEHRNDLADKIAQSLPGHAPRLTTTEGYEALFSEHFARLNPEERELHGIIRG